MNWPGKVSPQEWRWVFLAGAAVLLLTCVPYLVAWAYEGEGRVFGGFILLLDDCYSYLAKMRLGAAGRWLFRIAYTPEPHPGTLFFPFHILLGKLAALLPESINLTTRMVWVYHGARLVCGMILLLTVYRFLAALTGPEERTLRRLAWLMIAWGGGLGWLLVALGLPEWLGSIPLDFILPEGFTFLVLYAFPHIAAARSLLLWGFLSLFRVFEGREGWLRMALLAGVLWLLMGLVVPFYVPVAWAVTGALLAAFWLRRRHFPRRQLIAAAGAALLSAPVVGYSLWVFSTQPVYRAWSEQNLILSPHPLHYLAAWGVPLVLAGCAIGDAWRREGLTWTAPVWVGVVPLLVYLPFNLQRRLVEGVQIPLMLLAAMGTVKLARGGLRPVVAMLVATMVFTNIFILAGSSMMVRSRPPLTFRESAEIAALDWLAGQVQADDVILSAYNTGNYLPARVLARAFLGHGFETVEFSRKEAMVARFFAGQADESWRKELLSEYGVDYIFWGPEERKLGEFDPHAVPYLRPIYETAGYAIFAVLDESE